MRTPFALPEQFVRTILDLDEDEGAAWLRDLPALLRSYEQRWSVAVLAPFPNLSYNFVAPAVRSDGQAAVLKLGIPGAELLTEIAALRLYDSAGAVRLLDADEQQGALLLERLMPGSTLAEVADDQQATAVAAEVMRRLWRPAPPEHRFPSVADWAAGLSRLRREFEGGTGPFPKGLVETAEGLFLELLASMSTPVVLHGDLHHHNILRADREPWLAIDPKGVIGEPAYEIGALLRNQLQGANNLQQLLARRIDQVSEALGLDRRRLQAWGMAQAVLSAWWCYEDQGYGWEPTLDVAEALNGLL